MTTHLNESSFYRTTDLALAAAISLFRPLEAVDQTSDFRRYEFVFTHDQELDAFVEAYWRRGLKVDPRAYADAHRAIKARICG